MRSADLIPLTYGPATVEGGYYRPKPGGPLVPLAQARREGLGNVLGTEDRVQGSAPKTPEASIIASLKTLGYPDPPEVLVQAILGVVNVDASDFESQLERFVQILDAELLKMGTVDKDRMNEAVRLTVEKMGVAAGGVSAGKVASTFVKPLVALIIFFMILKWFSNRKAE